MADTESLRASYEVASTWSERATLTIAIGVLIELLALLIFSKGMARSEKVILVFANVLVVGGVAGDWIFEGRAANAAAMLQQSSDERVATLNLQIEQLRKSRTLDFFAQGQIVDAVKPFANTQFDLSVAPGDPEAFDFAKQLGGALKLAGWKWTDWSAGVLQQVYQTTGLPTIGQAGVNSGVGVVYFQDHAGTLSQPTMTLSQALNNSGVRANADAVGSDTQITNHEIIHIFIGKKPQ